MAITIKFSCNSQCYAKITYLFIYSTLLRSIIFTKTLYEDLLGKSRKSMISFVSRLQDYRTEFVKSTAGISPCRRCLLCVNQIGIYDFRSLDSDIIHPANPLHLILCYQIVFSKCIKISPTEKRPWNLRFQVTKSKWLLFLFRSKAHFIQRTKITFPAALSLISTT